MMIARSAAKLQDGLVFKAASFLLHSSLLDIIYLSSDAAHH
jgi:hypothetical protein